MTSTVSIAFVRERVKVMCNGEELKYDDSLREWVLHPEGRLVPSRGTLALEFKDDQGFHTSVQSYGPLTRPVIAWKPQHVTWNGRTIPGRLVLTTDRVPHPVHGDELIIGQLGNWASGIEFKDADAEWPPSNIAMLQNAAGVDKVVFEMLVEADAPSEEEELVEAIAPSGPVHPIDATALGLDMFPELVEGTPPSEGSVEAQAPDREIAMPVEAETPGDRLVVANAPSADVDQDSRSRPSCSHEHVSDVGRDIEGSSRKRTHEQSERGCKKTKTSFAGRNAYEGKFPSIFKSTISPMSVVGIGAGYRQLVQEWDEFRAEQQHARVLDEEAHANVEGACEEVQEYLDDEENQPAHCLGSPDNLLQHGIGETCRDPFVGTRLDPKKPLKVWVCLTFPVHKKGILYGPNGVGKCFTHKVEEAALKEYPALHRCVAYGDSIPSPMSARFTTSVKNRKMRALFLKSWGYLEAAKPSVIIFRQDDNRAWLWELILLPLMRAVRENPFESPFEGRLPITVVRDAAAITQVPSLFVENLAGIEGWTAAIFFTPHTCSVDPLKAIDWLERARAVEKSWAAVAALVGIEKVIDLDAETEPEESSFIQWIRSYRPSNGFGDDYVNGLISLRKLEIDTQRAYPFNELPPGVQHVLDIHGITAQSELIQTAMLPWSHIATALHMMNRYCNAHGLSALETELPTSPPDRRLEILGLLALAKSKESLRQQFRKWGLDPDTASFTELWDSQHKHTANGLITNSVKATYPTAVLCYCTICEAHTSIAGRRSSQPYMGNLASRRLPRGQVRPIIVHNCWTDGNRRLRVRTWLTDVSIRGSVYLYQDAIALGLPGATQEIFDQMRLAMAQYHNIGLDEVRLNYDD